MLKINTEVKMSDLTINQAREAMSYTEECIGYLHELYMLSGIPADKYDIICLTELSKLKDTILEWNMLLEISK